MGLIFRPRRPKSFNHIPIYWDPKREDLDRRIRKIRKELEEAGEIPAKHIVGESEYDEEVLEQGSIQERISESLFGGTHHLKKQRERGIDTQARAMIILRSFLFLITLGALVWVLFYR